MEVLFIDLSMKALNSLIWASAVLAKLGIVAAVVAGLLWLILILISMVSD